MLIGLAGFGLVGYRRKSKKPERYRRAQSGLARYRNDSADASECVKRGNSSGIS